LGADYTKALLIVAEETPHLPSDTFCNYLKWHLKYPEAALTRRGYKWTDRCSPRVPFQAPKYPYLWSSHVTEPTPVDIITIAATYALPLHSLKKFQTDFKHITYLPAQIALKHEIDTYLSGYLASQNRQRLLIPGEISQKVEKKALDAPNQYQRLYASEALSYYPPSLWEKLCTKNSSSSSSSKK